MHLEASQWATKPRPLHCSALTDSSQNKDLQKVNDKCVNGNANWLKLHICFDSVHAIFDDGSKVFLVMHKIFSIVSDHRPVIRSNINISLKLHLEQCCVLEISPSLYLVNPDLQIFRALSIDWALQETAVLQPDLTACSCLQSGALFGSSVLKQPEIQSPDNDDWMLDIILLLFFLHIPFSWCQHQNASMPAWTFLTRKKWF